MNGMSATNASSPVNGTNASFDPNRARSAMDVRALDSLKRDARDNSDKALVSAAKQFEAIFTQMLLKSMRDAVPESGLLGGNESKMFTSMFDQELAQKLSTSGRGLGIADMIVKQLSRGRANGDGASDDGAPNGSIEGASGLSPALRFRGREGVGIIPGESPAAAPPVGPRSGLIVPTTPQAPDAPGTSASVAVNVSTSTRDWLARLSSANQSASAPAAGGSNAAQAFVDRMLPHAQAAERTTGIPAHFILGQAALESGWGQREIRAADGSASFNLFGIKATGWNGRVADTMTTEYVNGQAQKSVERFRAYGSYTEAFQDYARMLAASPRYAPVLREGRDVAGFARGMQNAGYATDPAYADKLTRVINHTLSLARTG